MQQTSYSFFSRLSALCCLVGGLVLIFGKFLDYDHSFEIGIGLYFVGKSGFIWLLLGRQNSGF